MTIPLRVSSLALVAVLLPASALAAGNVRTEARGKRLFVRGDGAANVIQLEPGPGNGILVSGFNGTTVNGRDVGVIAPFAEEDLRIELDGGGDTVVVRDLVVPKDLWLELGRRGVEEEDDEEPDLIARAFAEDDENDAVVLQNVTAGRHLVVKLGQGNDTVDYSGGSAGDVRISAGPGRDAIAVSQVTCGKHMVLKGEGGDDDVSVDGARFLEHYGLSIDGHDGDDTVLVTNTDTRLIVRTRAGVDEVEVEDSSFSEYFKVDLGSEDDHVVLRGVLARRRSHLTGGPGIDTYTDAGGNRVRDGLVVEGFEILE